MTLPNIVKTTMEILSNCVAFPKNLDLKKKHYNRKKHNTQLHNMLIFTTMKIAEPIPDRLKRHSVSQIGHKGIAKM